MMTVPPPRRMPMIEGPQGHPFGFHWHRASEIAPGVKIGDVLLDEAVTEETATHFLTISYQLEPRS